MSLQNLARHVQSRGRGEDKMLVHMTPGEVQGLQALAMRHGGSLSINPETGLPEAGFLRNILPSVVGGAVGIATMNPMLGAAVGGGLGLATSGGNLSKGIMSGIGAYGFGSLGATLAGSGATALAPEAIAGGLGVQGAATGAGSQAAMLAQQNAGLGLEGIESIRSAASGATGFNPATVTPMPSTMGSIQEGFKQAASSPGAFFKQNMFPIGAAALGTLAASSPEQKYGTTTVDQGQIQPYTYTQTRNPEFGKVPGAAYFNQTFTAGTPYAAKQGGIVELADGGVVERMSAMNQQSGMYPQGMLTNAQYAVPTQRPASMEIVKSDYDTYVNPMTGLGREFAGGGIVALADGGIPPVPVQVPPVDPIAVAPNLGRYSQPATAVNPSVTAYNQILADRAANEYVAQAPLLTMLPGGGERANAADTAKIINEYYLSSLGRPGEQAGLDYWAQRKAQTGESLADIKKEIQATPEGQLNRLYTETLGRKPDVEGLRYWQGQLASGVPIEEIRKQFEASPEFANTDYGKYLNAPPSKETFDEQAYLAANPDAFRDAPGRAWQHYLEANAAGDKRAFTRLPYVPKTAAPSVGSQGGYSYDPATGKYTKAPTAPTQDFSGFLGPIANDPNFQNYLQQQYQQYQAAQQGGGGKSGGLMPKALKYASGGISNLGDYSDGGRLLKGPGDGVSDSIPAQIGARQPARLADGEFVVPARIVSELGNGSTDAGARKLYAMMDRIQKKRRKSIGKNKVAVDSKAEAVLPA